MRKSLLLFVLLAALSAGLLAGACAAVQGRREAVSYQAETLAGDPAAADGVELTWVSTCGYHLFWHSTFPASAPEEAETRFSYSGRKQTSPLEPETVNYIWLSLSEMNAIRPDSDFPFIRTLWERLARQTEPQPGDRPSYSDQSTHTFQRSIPVADILEILPLSADALYYELNALSRDALAKSNANDRFSRLFLDYFPIPVPDGLTATVSMTVTEEGELSSAYLAGFDNLTLEAQGVKTGNSALFALCLGGVQAPALDDSRIPGGWGIYRLSPDGTLETVYSIPDGRYAIGLWLDGLGSLLLLTSDGETAFLTLLDQSSLTPLDTLELFPLDAAAAPPHFRQMADDHSYLLLTTEDALTLFTQDPAARWAPVFTADASLQSSLGCSLTANSHPHMDWDGNRLAILSCYGRANEKCWLAIYDVAGLAYLGCYTSSLYGNQPPDSYSWGFWLDGSCRSIALEPSFSGAETAS